MKKKYILVLFFFLIINKLYSEEIMIMELKDGVCRVGTLFRHCT